MEGARATYEATRDVDAKMAILVAIADAMLDQIARTRAATLDANSFLYMVRAYKLYDVRHRLHESRARYLFIPSETDMVFPPHLSTTAVEELQAAGLDAELFILNVSGGHLDGLAKIDQAQPDIEKFLAKGPSPSRRDGRARRQG